jgi:Tol biopolymer transport system component
VSHHEHPPDPPQAKVASDRLDSWKEIAAYLKRDVTTVRRWEKREGLPVHRHRHEQRESVYAFANELDSWWESRRGNLANGNGSVADAPLNGADAGPAPRRAAFFVVAAVGVAAGVALTFGALRMWPSSVDDSEYRFTVFPPEQTSFGSVSLSPNGRYIAFTASPVDGPSMLFLRSLDAVTSKPIPGTEGAAFPFWSPSSDEIGFFAGGQLRAIGLSAATHRVVCSAPNGRGGTWNKQGQIVFTPHREGPLARVPDAGGDAVPVSVLATGERGHLWPEFLPDGDHFLYLADSAEPQHHHLYIGSITSSDRKHLFPLVSSAAYARGQLFFARDRQLLTAPFDARRLRVTGEPIVVGDDVLQQWDHDHKTDFSVSEAGPVVFRSLSGPDTKLVWRDRAERHSQVITPSAAQHFEPTLSPDQKRIAVDVFEPRSSKPHTFGLAALTSDIWIMEDEGGAASRLTFDPAADLQPVWSPDGTRIAFSSNRRGPLDLYLRRIDGAAGDELLYASAENKHALAWSPDGRWLVYGSYDPKTHGDLWLLPIDGQRLPVPLLRGEASEEQTQISPDGRWFAYTSNESGRDEIYVQSFPTPAGKWQVSVAGGGDPRWRHDGKELFFIGDDRRLMAANVTAGEAFKSSVPVPIFDTGMKPQWGAARNLYDVSPDGQRFLFMTPVADDRLSPFIILLNWSPDREK